MLQGIVECAGWHIYIRLPGNRHSSRFYRMLKLPVTSPLSDLIPAILFQNFNQLLYLHYNANLDPTVRSAIELLQQNWNNHGL